jgi:hypothetical protein
MEKDYVYYKTLSFEIKQSNTNAFVQLVNLPSMSIEYLHEATK